MAYCSSFTVSAKQLVVIALFVLITVGIEVKYTYFFSIYSILSTFSSNYSAETSNILKEIFDYSLQNGTTNTLGQPFEYSIQNGTSKSLGQLFHSSQQNGTSKSLGQLLDSSQQNGTSYKAQFPPKLVSEHPFLMDKVINPHNFDYVIRPTVKCSGREVELVISVPISRDKNAVRSVIRRTWGSYANHTNNNAVLLFFVGSENSYPGTQNLSATQSRLQEEALLFGDIVQENYIDCYRNLSLKTMSILKWVNTFCPNTKYILKVDGDMYVNIQFMMKSLQEFVAKSSPPNAFIIGCLLANGSPIRYNVSKWYTPKDLYKQDKYPNFVSGTAYAMTSKAALLSYEASLRLPLFWLEDVYITGLCAKKAQVRVYGSKFFYNGKLVASGCSFRTMVSGHGYTKEEIIKIHSELFDPNLKC